MLALRHLRGAALAALVASCLVPSCAPDPGAIAQDGDARVRARVAVSMTRAISAELGGFGAHLGEAVQPGSLFRPLAPSLDFALPARADGTIVIRRGDASVRLRRSGLGSAAGRIEDGALVYGDAHAPARSYSVIEGSALEELFVLDRPAPALGYALDLPVGWRLQASPRDAQRVFVVDPRGAPVLRVSADKAWDRSGAPIDVALEIDGAALRVRVAPDAEYPIVVDPTFADAVSPLKLRTFHTATALADGRVLVAGGFKGSVFDASAELYDPSTASSSFLPPMAEARGNHTATLLRDGRVLVSGGTGPGGALASTELYDPAQGKFVAGPTMDAARSSHVSVLLADGRVLLLGDGSGQIFDPQSDSLSAVANVPAILGPIATLLDDGRVLVVAGQGGVGAVAFLYDPAAGSFTPTGAPTTFDPGAGASILTRLRDGRVLILGGCPCGSIGGPTFSSSTAEVWSASANGFTQVGDTTTQRLGPTATLLPSGKVLIAGETDWIDTFEGKTAEIFDPTTDTFAAIPDQMNALRRGHTATLLPNGDVLILGGNQASAELFVGEGAAGTALFGASPDLLGAREDHTATGLEDGRVLLAGGRMLAPGVEPDAEIYDPVSRTFSAAGPMVVLRDNHTASLLPSGRVLLAGGGVATAELFDPSTGAFAATANGMVEARANAAATRLPDGRVLIVSGQSGEIFDEKDESFTAVSNALPTAMAAPGAALLPNGKVLIVGATSAALYDPVTDTFAATGNPGVVRPESGLQYGDNVISVVVTPSGKALVTGGQTLAAELYDPASETFSFTGAASQDRINQTLTMLPTGQALLFGGNQQVAEPFAFPAAEIFDPGGAPGGAFFSLGGGAARAIHTASLLPNGDVLLAGGGVCFAICFPEQTRSSQRWSSPLASASGRPVIAGAPSSVKGGSSVTLTGSGLRGIGSSDGRSNASTAEAPHAFWQPLAHPTVVPGELSDWADGAAVWHVPATGYAGLGRLYVEVDGRLSDPALVTIEPADDAIGCRFDVECGSGHCADGVCCDTVCDGVCEGCTAARKGSGVDGVCGAVPPERDPADACVVSEGGPCSEAAQCATGFCEDGVCCQSACDGQCEACDVSGSVGICVPVTGAPHAGHAACQSEAPPDVCDTRVCDGVDRTQCAATVGPCVPFACAADGCLASCNTNDECAPGHHCDAGVCISGQCDGSKATTPQGDVVDCAPYTCQPDGSCRTSCATVDDCASPSACNFEGRCVPRPPPDDPSACDCRAAGAPGSRGALPGLLALGAILALARRRRVAGIAVGVLALLGLARSGAAQPKEPAKEPAKAADGAPAPKKEDAAPSDEARKAEAEERFKRGLAHVKDQRWSSALAEFMESRRLFPTRSSAQNAAFCLQQLKRFDEALDLYEGVLRDYPDMDEAKQKEALKAIADLKPLVGAVEVEGAEPGATILVDGVQRATFPAAAPIRVIAASHVVRVFKRGFQPFEQRVEVAGRGTARVEAKLSPLTESGTLKIADADGRELSVLVDNVEVGKTPFEGLLAVGKHVVVLRGEGGLGTPPTAAPIEQNKTTTLALKAVPLEGRLRVQPSPAGALVTIGAVPVGLGTWEGALPVGKHRVEISADGFLPIRRDVDLTKDEPAVVSVVLERDESDARWRVPGKIAFEASGAVNLFPSYFGNTTDGCGDGCSQSVGLGALALVHASYEFPSGIGLGVTGGYVFATQSVDGRTTAVRPVGLPPREGSVTDVVRAQGGLAALHVSYHFGDRAPVLLRLAAGPWFGFLRDERVGSFSLSDGFSYQAGPAIQEPFAVYLAVTPEVRFFYRFAEKFELSLGLATPVLVSLTRPQWDPSKEVDAAVDGIGAFNGEDLTGPVFFLASPGLGARYAF